MASLDSTSSGLRPRDSANIFNLSIFDTFVLGLTEDELAFYDALETNDSAVAVLGDQVLKQIALELTQTIRDNATIDWTLRENIRAKLRVRVRHILRKYGYPPDKQQKATETVIKQAEMLTELWTQHD